MTTVPLSLYIDIEHGEYADLEVAARSAIYWSEYIKETAYIFDPSIHVETKLKSGSEGSLSLHSIIRFIKTGSSSKRAKDAITGIIIGASAFLTENTLTYFQYQLLDEMKAGEAIQRLAEFVGLDGEDACKDLSEEEIQNLAERLAEYLERQKRNTKVNSIFRELQRDTNVRGVGVAVGHEQMPKNIVKRPDFESFTSEIDTEGEKRTRYPEAQLSIISPRFKDDDKVWRFQGPEGEFNARVNDKKFRHDFTNGNLQIDVGRGLTITAILRVEEEKENGVWVTKKRYIEEVLNYQNEPYERDLFAENEEGETTNNNQDKSESN